MATLQWLKLRVRLATGAVAATLHKPYANEIALAIQEFGEKSVPPIEVDLSTIVTKYVNSDEPHFRCRTLSTLVTAVVDGGEFEHKTSDGKITYALVPSIWEGDTTTGRAAVNKRVWGFLNVSNPDATLTPEDLRGPWKVAFSTAGINMMNTSETGGIEPYLLPADTSSTLSTRKVKPGCFTIHELDYAGPSGAPPEAYSWPDLLRNIKVKGIEVHFSPSKEMASDLGICFVCLKPGAQFKGDCTCVPADPRPAAGPSKGKKKKAADDAAVKAMKAKRAAL